MVKDEIMLNRNKSAAAFTLVELLISLAITGILLAAIAVAFNASVINYYENEGIAKAVKDAHQTLSRITTELRTASAVEPNEPSNQCSMITISGDDITYQYNNTDNKVYLITNADSTDDDYVLCDDVTAMTFQKTTKTVDSVTYVTSVQISMTITNAHIQRTFSAAAVIRKNLDID